MAALAARGDARLVRAYARHAAARDGAELLAVADEFAAIGALRYGLEAAVAAADAYQRAGDRERAPAAPPSAPASCFRTTRAPPSRPSKAWT